MKIFALIGILLVTTACAEIFEGPRVVRYPDSDRMYVRHVPLFPMTENSTTQVAEVASSICQEDGRTAELVDVFQIYDYDIRYSTFACR
jgi:hypothetical protein